MVWKNDAHLTTVLVDIFVVNGSGFVVKELIWHWAMALSSLEAGFVVAELLEARFLSLLHATFHKKIMN